jgi:hypothetical protein
MSDQPAAKEAKKPSITYAVIHSQAAGLADSGKLTTAWIREKLGSKPPKDFTEKELTALKAELEDFLEQYNAANGAE